MINISILVLIIIIFINLINKNKESFNEFVTFLDKPTTCKKLKKINYSYNKKDIHLRNIPKKYSNNIYKFYCSNLKSFTTFDKTAFNWLIESIKQKLPKRFTFILKNLKIAKFNDQTDNGYPHTNLDIIFFPESFFSDILEHYNNNDILKAIKHEGAILIHECIHIWQRLMPDLFYLLYKDFWLFTKPKKIKNKSMFDLNIRFNPDGPDTDWVFNDKILFLSVYKSNAENLGDVNYIGLYLDKVKDGEYTIPNPHKKDDLLNIKEFTDFFTHIYGNHYHPNELSAELMSIYYLKIMKVSHKNYTNTAFGNLILWFNDNIDKIEDNLKNNISL